MLGFKVFHSVTATIAGIETAHIIRKGQCEANGLTAFQQYDRVQGPTAFDFVSRLYDPQGSVCYRRNICISAACSAGGIVKSATWPFQHLAKKFPPKYSQGSQTNQSYEKFAAFAVLCKNGMPRSITSFGSHSTGCQIARAEAIAGCTWFMLSSVVIPSKPTSTSAL